MMLSRGKSQEERAREQLQETLDESASLLKQVWGYQDPGGSDVVRVTVHRLRRKLESDPARPHLLHTIPGVGVLLKADSEAASSELSHR